MRNLKVEAPKQYLMSEMPIKNDVSIQITLFTDIETPAILPITSHLPIPDDLDFMYERVLLE